ncbi:hypothetical protein LCGC14_2541500, partial [marine sediment metagenome]
DGVDQAKDFTLAAHEGGATGSNAILSSVVFYRSASGGDALTDAVTTSLYNSTKGKLCADMSGAELTNRVGCWDMTEDGGPYVDSQGSNDLTGINTPTRDAGLVERSDSGMSVHGIAASTQRLTLADNADLSKIADFHMVYDPDLRAIRIFVVRSNQTLPDVCMVFFIDRPADEAWVQHRYYSTAFASCSTLVRVAAGDWKIYTGGQTGHVYKLESTTINDDGVYFYNGFTTPELAFNAPRGKKRYDHNRLIMRLLGSEVIQENVFIDGVPVSGGFSLVDENGNNVVDENGNQVVGYEFDSFTFTLDAAVALQRANRLQDAKHSTGKAGIRIQSEIFNDVINEKMFISQILYDHTPQGVQTD